MGFRKSTAALITVLALTATPAWGAERTSTEIKADSLRFLQELRNENVSRLKEIDQTLSKKMEENAGSVLDVDVNSLKEQQKEHALRQKFLNSLILQIDTKFGGGDLRSFLERSLTDMAKIDAVQSSANSGLWKFMKYAADAMKRLPERKENILAFLEGYMRKSISDPIRPEDYLKSRNYTNGAKSETGAPLNRAEAGEIADRRLHEMDGSINTEAPRAR